MNHLSSLQQEVTRALLLEKFPKEKQEELLSRINETLLERLFYATLDKLSPEDRETFLAKNEDPQSTPQDLDTFLHEAIADYDAFVAENVEAFLTKLHTHLS